MIFFFGFAILYPNKPTHFHIHFLSIRLNCPTSCLLFPSTDIVCLRNAARPLDMSAPISTTIIIYPTATNHAVLALNPQQPCLPSTHNSPVCHPVRLWPPRQDGRLLWWQSLLEFWNVKESCVLSTNTPPLLNIYMRTTWSLEVTATKTYTASIPFPDKSRRARLLGTSQPPQLSFLSCLGHTLWKRTRCDLYNMTYFGFTIKILNYKRIL